MSEERFCYGETDLFEWVEDNGEMISKKCYKWEKENENLESNIRFFSNQLKKLRGHESYE